MKNQIKLLLPFALLSCLALAGCGDESDVVPEDNEVIDYQEGPEEETSGVQVQPPSNLDGENPATAADQQPRLQEENTQAQGQGGQPPQEPQEQAPAPEGNQDDQGDAGNTQPGEPTEATQTQRDSQDTEVELVTPEGTEPALNEQQKAAAENAEPAVVIEMTDSYRFDPTTATVTVGDTVKWTNVASTRHTVSTLREEATSPDNVSLPEGAEPFSSGKILPEESWSYTFTVPGEYRYYCLPHQSNGMVGVIHVEPGAQ